MIFFLYIPWGGIGNGVKVFWNVMNNDRSCLISKLIKFLIEWSSTYWWEEISRQYFFSISFWKVDFVVKIFVASQWIYMRGQLSSAGLIDFATLLKNLLINKGRRLKMAYWCTACMNLMIHKYIHYCISTNKIYKIWSDLIF